MQLRRSMIAALLAALAWLSTAAQVQAAFHLWKINEVFTNASGSVQFIEMINGVDPNQGVLSATNIDSNSSVPFNFPSDLAGSTANKTFLIATPGFGALPGGVTPDYTLPANFFSVAGDTINFGGGLDIFTFSGAQIPHNGILSLNRNLTTGTNSPRNFHDQQGSVVVTEPSTMVLVGLAGSLLMIYRARRRR